MRKRVHTRQRKRSCWGGGGGEKKTLRITWGKGERGRSQSWGSLATCRGRGCVRMSAVLSDTHTHIPPSGEITPLIQHALSDRQDPPSSPSKDMKRSPLWFKYQGWGLEIESTTVWRGTARERHQCPCLLLSSSWLTATESLVTIWGSGLPLASCWEVA